MSARFLTSRLKIVYRPNAFYKYPNQQLRFLTTLNSNTYTNNLHQSKLQFSTSTKQVKPSNIQYETQLPDEAESDGEQEYIPEVDWDHTKAAEHIKRGYGDQQPSNTLRERIYDGLLATGVAAALIGVFGMISFAVFSWFKMKKQLNYVNFAQKKIRQMRQKFKTNPELRNQIPFDAETMDVTPIKNMLLAFVMAESESETFISDDTHSSDSDTNQVINPNIQYIRMEDLNMHCTVWKTLVEEYKLPINDILDFERTGVVDLQDVTYFLALLQYFLGQPRRKGTPSVRRVVRDDIYKMLNTYDPDIDFVNLENMGSYASACFSLAILSPPNLGNEKIGGQTLDDFKVNYVKYMIREQNKELEDEVTMRRFNFLYKICDFGIGLTPETRGQLAK